MGEQLGIKIFQGKLDRVTVAEGFSLLWQYHLATKPCQRQYRSNCKALIKSFGNKLMANVTEVDVIQHKEARLRGINGFRAVGPGTVFHDHTLTTLLFNKMAEWRRRRMVFDGIDFSDLKLPSENPTKHIQKKKAPPRTTIVNRNEFSRLLEHSTDRVREIIYFGMHNAIRPGDLARLEVKAWNENRGRLEFTQHKTGKFQSLPISRQQREVIREAAKVGRQHILDFTNFKKEWEAARRKAKLWHIQFRDLRRTAINEVTRYSGNPMHAQRIAGHASFRTTVEHYVVMETIDLGTDIKHLSKKFF